MKKLLFASLVLLCSCTSYNDSETLEWIDGHPKPIVCRLSGRVGWDYTAVYTLMDAHGHLYVTKPTLLNLPDTIKAVK